MEKVKVLIHSYYDYTIKGFDFVVDIEQDPKKNSICAWLSSGRYGTKSFLFDFSPRTCSNEELKDYLDKIVPVSAEYYVINHFDEEDRVEFGVDEAVLNELASMQAFVKVD